MQLLNSAPINIIFPLALFGLGCHVRKSAALQGGRVQQKTQRNVTKKAMQHRNQNNLMIAVFAAPRESSPANRVNALLVGGRFIREPEDVNCMGVVHPEHPNKINTLEHMELMKPLFVTAYLIQRKRFLILYPMSLI